MRRIMAAVGVGMAMIPALVLSLPVRAAILYSQNFDPPVPTSSTATGPGGFVQNNNISGTGWQAQGGGGGGGISQTSGVDANGPGGSQALFVNNNHSTAMDFTFNQYTVYGAVAAAGAPASQVRVSMDLLIDGSESANDPVEVIIQNNGADLSFRPTLTNGAFTHVSYLLSQASNVGSFNPAVSSNLRIQHGAGGFGFDANNIVRLDNVIVETIPEPSALLLAGLCGSILLYLRGRAGEQTGV